MSNSDQKVYTLAFGECTGEFIVTYNFLDGPPSGGSVTISENTATGKVNNTFYQDTGSRSALLNSEIALSVSFTNNFNYPIDVTVDFCSFGIQIATVQPNETTNFSRDFGECNYTLTWQSQSQTKISKQSSTPGSIEVIWDEISLASGDVTGAGSLSLIKDKITPATGKLIITAPPGTNWAVYLDCPFCESDTSDFNSYESDATDVSEECCKVVPPPGAGAILNPSEYLFYSQNCIGASLDIEMTPKCPNTQKISSQQSNPYGCCCARYKPGTAGANELAWKNGWNCIGYTGPGGDQGWNSLAGQVTDSSAPLSFPPIKEVCESLVPYEDCEIQWVPGEVPSQQSPIGSCGTLSNSSTSEQKCVGGDPLGSRVHIADITPEMAEQYWQDLLDSCQGTAYGPFPIMAKPSCSLASIGQEPEGLDLGGNDIQKYLDRDRKNYCPVDQELKFGPLYMIGSDGNGGCVPIPMKYIICNGCSIGMGISFCEYEPEGCESDSEESDSGSDLPPFEIPPPALPPEQPMDGLGGQVRFNFAAFNFPLPPFGQPAQQGQNQRRPRDINLRVGRMPARQVGQQVQQVDCNRALAVFSVTGCVLESSFKIDNVLIELFINGQRATFNTITMPKPGDVLDWSTEVGLTKNDNGSYNFKFTFTPMEGYCGEPQIFFTESGNITVIEEVMFTSYKTCDGQEIQVETYCDGTLAQEIPETVEQEEVCYLGQAIVKIASVNEEDLLYGANFINECGDQIEARLIKREHNPKNDYQNSPQGCANYNLVYHLINTTYRKDEIPLSLTLPSKGIFSAYTSENLENVILKKDPEIYNISNFEELSCEGYTSLSTTYPPPLPSQEMVEPVKTMILDQDGLLAYETTVGNPNLKMKFSPGTTFFTESGEQVMQDFNFILKQSGGLGALGGSDQWGMASAGGWFFDGEGAIFRIFTWDHGAIDCHGNKITSWSSPGELKANLELDYTSSEIADAVNNGVIDIFKLNRDAINRGGSQGEWQTIGGAAFDPVTGELSSNILSASTWNIDTKVEDVCGVFLVYPPSELLKSRKITDRGPISTLGQVSSSDNLLEVSKEIQKHRYLQVEPGIGVRFWALNSNVFLGQKIDTIISSWPQVFINWPKNDPITRKPIKFMFEFYDTNKQGIYKTQNEFTIMSGIPAPPGDPNAPTCCKTVYENPTPGITSICVLNTCGDDNPCKIKRVTKELKGSIDGTLGGAE